MHQPSGVQPRHDDRSPAFALDLSELRREVRDKKPLAFLRQSVSRRLEVAYGATGTLVL
jgi:hypothetical protein